MIEKSSLFVTACWGAIVVCLAGVGVTLKIEVMGLRDHAARLVIIMGLIFGATIAAFNIVAG